MRPRTQESVSLVWIWILASVAASIRARAAPSARLPRGRRLRRAVRDRRAAESTPPLPVVKTPSARMALVLRARRPAQELGRRARKLRGLRRLKMRRRHHRAIAAAVLAACWTRAQARCSTTLAPIAAGAGAAPRAHCLGSAPRAHSLARALHARGGAEATESAALRKKATADAAQRSGEFADAATGYEAALAALGDDDEPVTAHAIRLNLARCRLQLEEFELAAAACDAVLAAVSARSPLRATALYRRAVAKQHLDDLTAAHAGRRRNHVARRSPTVTWTSKSVAGRSAETSRGDAAGASRIVRGDDEGMRTREEEVNR